MKMVKVQFTYDLLNMRTLRTEHLSQILDHFPENTFVVNVSSGHGLTTEIFFECQEFEDVLPHLHAPVLQATFRTCADGSSECVSVGPWKDGIDTSKAFTSNGIAAINVNLNGAVVTQTPMVFAGPNPTLYFNTSSSCSHEWGEYRGIFDNYKYCKKCNVKGDKIDP